jgi:hypothetical protein
MEKRLKNLVGAVGRVFVALVSVLGGPVAPAMAKPDETQSATSRADEVATKIDAIRRAFEARRMEMPNDESQRLQKLAQNTTPFNEFGNFVSWLDFQSFQDFHNFGEFNNNM